MRIIFAGGGTAGHINPALAIANFILKRRPDSEFLFVGTKRGLEGRLVSEAGFDIKFIDVAGLDRKRLWRNFSAARKMILSFIESKKIIKNFAPDIVIGTGGYVSGPVLYAAHRFRIPTIAHESNAVPGLTTKFLANFASRVTLGFSEASEFLPRAKTIATGNPIRPELLMAERRAARKNLNLDERPFLLLFGGSLGAERLNQVFADFVADRAKDGKFQILMCAGTAERADFIKRKIDVASPDFEKSGAIKIVPYISDMASALAAADLVVSRSGAVSVSEIAALRKPSILIPSPNVTNNHQERNADVLAKVGAAIKIMEDNLSPKSFKATIDKIFDKSETLEKMTAALENLPKNNAFEKICDRMEEIVQLGSP
jgi:UDP-N-acetylglucosamine--N-acetylmuramyl-(pentapeptide) pyrophosphoryl-undecaprenol N-acetylglucosamine transferase